MYCEAQKYVLFVHEFYSLQINEDKGTFMQKIHNIFRMFFTVFYLLSFFDFYMEFLNFWSSFCLSVDTRKRDQ